MERAVEVFAVVQFVIVGLSHIAQPRTWAHFFIHLRGQGQVGVFVVAFLSLWFGSMIVAFHNVWSGIPVVLTVLGWAQVLKALTYFAFPGFGLRRLGFVSEERAWAFPVAGVFLLALGALLAYDLALT